MSILSSEVSSIFDRWASSYDEQPNPLLALEERTFPQLMPQIAGADVLDVGCGTGRWLSRLQALSPASLNGMDYSVAMLGRARTKLAPTTRLYAGDASSLSEADSSCDVILASFVISYVADVNAFANECSRVLRAGGAVLLSDMHPATAARQGWTRSFKVEGKEINLPAMCRSLDEIVTAFAQSGLHLSKMAEPAFGEPEMGIFERAGKLRGYTSLVGIPAIFLCRFEKGHVSSASFDLQLANAPWSADASNWSTSLLSVQDGLIETLDGSQPSIDLTGYVLLPGLINAHDHLEFALFPNLGRTPCETPYRNATEWATEIHQRHATTIEHHLRVPLKTRLWWGAIRNLLCGVTTVCHHNAHHAEFDISDFPVQVLSRFGWAHSLTYASNVVESFQQTPLNQPFILHAGEGSDASSREELYELDRLHLLDNRAVLVHGLALKEAEVAILNGRGASLVLCPTSNQYLFERTMAQNLIASIDRVALGSDSPLTAAGDLLDEVQYLHVKQSIDELTLFKMVTSNSAAILHLSCGEGSISSRQRGDVIAVRDTGGNPAQTLAHLTFADVELVLLSGRVAVVSPSLYARLPEQHRAGLELLQVEGHQRHVRAPIAGLLRSAEEILGRGNLRLGGKEIRHVDIA